jgi:hypothetical protein
MGRREGWGQSFKFHFCGVTTSFFCRPVLSAAKTELERLTNARQRWHCRRVHGFRGTIAEWGVEKAEVSPSNSIFAAKRRLFLPSSPVRRKNGIGTTDQFACGKVCPSNFISCGELILIYDRTSSAAK